MIPTSLHYSTSLHDSKHFITSCKYIVVWFTNRGLLSEMMLKKTSENEHLFINMKYWLLIGWKYLTKQRSLILHKKCHCKTLCQHKILCELQLSKSDCKDICTCWTNNDLSDTSAFLTSGVDNTFNL